MSMSTWHNYGYGINTRKITTDEERLKAFIESQPSVKSKILEWEKQIIFNCSGDAEAEAAFYSDNARDLCDLYIEYGDNNDIDGFAGLAHMLLSSSTGLPLIACRDSNTDDCYILAPPCYPWETTEAYSKIKSLDELKTVFEKNIAALTDQTLDELDWGEQNIEGWCS